MDYTTLLDNGLVEEAFGKHLGLFAHPKGAHLTQRTRPLGEWADLRAGFNTWPYARTLQERPGTETCLESQNGRKVQGINFGSQDYLGLASHPAVLEAAMAAHTPPQIDQGVDVFCRCLDEAKGMMG